MEKENIKDYSATTEHPDPERIKKMFGFATLKQAEDYIASAEKYKETYGDNDIDDIVDDEHKIFII
jgi:hypothetical protein